MIFLQVQMYARSQRKPLENVIIKKVRTLWSLSF